MKAQVLFDINNLQLQEIVIPTLKPSEVLVKVHATGICGSDIPRIYETGAHRHPLICGHEFSGEVVEVAEDVNNNWVGKKVGIFPLIPCNNCASCKNKKYEMCKNYNYLGSRCDGGFAEYVAVPEWNLIELPERVTYEQAAMLEPTAESRIRDTDMAKEVQQNSLYNILSQAGMSMMTQANQSNSAVLRLLQ